ncbi:MAG: DUF429 domain-containing protein [Fervidicoccaceae archaeon]
MSSGRKRNKANWGERAVIVGIDLSLRRETYLCIYHWGGRKFIFRKAMSNDDIIQYSIAKSKRYRIIVVIDAPLSVEKKYRDLDRLVTMIGGKVLPVSFPSIRELAKRGIEISKVMKKLRKDAIVVETHPRSAARAMGFHDAREMAEKILTLKLSKDYADAAACCIVGIMLLFGKVIEIVSSDGKDVFVLPVLL